MAGIPSFPRKAALSAEKTYAGTNTRSQLRYWVNASIKRYWDFQVDEQQMMKIFFFFVRKAKAQDCKAIPRHAVRRCITNNYSPSDRRNYTQNEERVLISSKSGKASVENCSLSATPIAYTQNEEKTRRYRDLQSATTKRHFPHPQCSQAKYHQIKF